MYDNNTIIIFDEKRRTCSLSTYDKKIQIELRRISEDDPKKCYLIKTLEDSCEIYMIEDVDRILPLIDKYI